MPSELTFIDVDNAHLRTCFLEAYEAFSCLHLFPLSLQLTALPGYTMRAQPVLNYRIVSRSRRTYRIQMSNHLQIAEHIPLAELPRDVLVGWFAHELGHIVDYHQRSLWSLIWFTLGYFIFPTYRQGAERRADLFALDHGFGREILAAKNYLLAHATLPTTYKLRLKKYYLSPTELEEILQEQENKLAASEGQS